MPQGSYGAGGLAQQGSPEPPPFRPLEQCSTPRGIMSATASTAFRCQRWLVKRVCRHSLCYCVRPSTSEITMPADRPCDLCGSSGWIRPINGPSKPCPRCNAVGENIVAPDEDAEPTRVRLDPKRRVRRPRLAVNV